MISAKQIDQVSLLVTDEGLSVRLLDRLRQQFPGVHFTQCMDDDVLGAVPVREEDGFNLYLVDSRSHCLSLTNDADVASGFVVAECEPDT